MSSLAGLVEPIYALFRIVVGGLFAQHGAQKLFGVLGGMGGTSGATAAVGSQAWIGGVIGACPSNRERAHEMACAALRVCGRRPSSGSAKAGMALLGRTPRSLYV